MNILLTMNLPYFGDPGFNNGATKANRYLLERLAQRGHHVRVVVPTLQAAQSRLSEAEYLSGLACQGLEVTVHRGVYTYTLHGVQVHAVGESLQLRPHLTEQTAQFNPDWLLVSSEDWAQGLLELALKLCPRRVIYLCLSPTYLPFGPQAFSANPFTTKLLHQVAQIISGSKFISDYIREWGQLDSTMFYWPSYEAGPFPYFGCFDRGFVTMINPCDVKGISLFLDLAQHFPETQFAVVPTWGTTPENRAALEQLPNVHFLEAVEHIDEIFAQTRLLLMPTLFPEGVGLTTVEAMLRGIPVLASNVGALPEMKLGTDFLLPVKPIEHFTETLDTTLIPKPIVPEQDPAPWRAALGQLLEDRTLYEAQSQIARTRALEFVGGLKVQPFEDLLQRLCAQTTPVQSAPTVLENLEDLTPEQQELLLLWLEQQDEAAPPAPTVAPRHFPLEQTLIALWAELTGETRDATAPLSADEPLLARLLALVQTRLGQIVPRADLPGALTLEQIGRVIQHQNTWLGKMLTYRQGQNQTRAWPLLAQIRPTGSRPPLFFVTPLGGTFGSSVVVGVLDLAYYLDPQIPLYGLQAPALAAQGIPPAQGLEGAVRAVLTQIREIQPHGPYYIAGFCSGGLLATEAAYALRQQGEPVASLVLVDPVLERAVAPAQEQARQDWEAAALAWFVARDLMATGWDVPDLYQTLSLLPPQERWEVVLTRLKSQNLVPADTTVAEMQLLFEQKQANDAVITRLMGGYQPRIYHGPVSVLVTEQMSRGAGQAVLEEFRHYMRGPLKIQFIPGDHGTLFLPPHVQELTAHLSHCLAYPPT
ncbi:alpha/beta fold hydrolase [Anthocerotibacter panamensis]|uniref:alpha/beta fold hydrolase n=1 Tax=Anthocerotibacter panamensis TaxID=2857077 RepID=UPI001C402C8F|nr:alpha/beta fold hydrolase [Anthocerotibacter panamensis]